MEKLTCAGITKMIDHALLKPEMTREEVKEGCLTALKYDTASVCVRSCDVAFAAEILKDSGVKVGTVVGFPHGAALTPAKVAEAKAALEAGAHDVDMVIAIGMLKSGEYEYVKNDIEAVLETVRAHRGVLKVIFENCYLTKDEIIKACEICSSLDVDFVKTSTGFGSSGAKAQDVALMRKHTKPSVEVKASGGIRTLDDVIAMVEAGAARLGVSATDKIAEEAKKRGL